MFQSSKQFWGQVCLAVVLMVGLALGGTEPQPAGAAEKLTITEKLLAEKSPQSSPKDKEDFLSPDGEKITWRDKRGSKWVVMVNGEEEGRLYSKVEYIIFSPDSQHLVYRAKNGSTWTMVLDGEDQGGKYKELGNPRFSPDSQRLAYRAKLGKEWVAVVDGEPGTAYRKIGRIVFSPDSQHYAYTARIGKQWRIVRDGVEGPLYDSVGPPRFTPDSEGIVYPIKIIDSWMLSVDGRKFGPPRKNGYRVLGFTPDEEELIYAGWGGRGMMTLFIGKKAGPLVHMVALPILFGNGKHKVLYAAAEIELTWRGERALGRIVIDGVESPVYEAHIAGDNGTLWRGPIPHFAPRWHGVSEPELSPDGDHVAYIVRRKDGDYQVVLDDQPGPQYHGIPCGPSFNPEGKLFYVAQEEGVLILIVDGKREDEFTWAGVDACTDILFTADGEHFIYTAVQGGRWFESGFTARGKRRVFVDGIPGAVYDAKGTGSLIVMQTGETIHLSYAVHENKLGSVVFSLVVQDGLEGKRYDRVFGGTLMYEDDRTVTYLAQRGRKFFRVTQSLPDSRSEPDE